MPILSRAPEQLPANEALPWQRQAAHRFSTLWLLKACGTAAFMPLFFLGYFGVLQYPLSPATVMPLTVVDAWIPFTPAAFGFSSQAASTLISLQGVVVAGEVRVQLLPLLFTTHLFTPSPLAAGTPSWGLAPAPPPR